jgi:hypothetical protein
VQMDWNNNVTHANRAEAFFFDPALVRGEIICPIHQRIV